MEIKKFYSEDEMNYFIENNDIEVIDIIPQIEYEEITYGKPSFIIERTGKRIESINIYFLKYRVKGEH